MNSSCLRKTRDHGNEHYLTKSSVIQDMQADQPSTALWGIRYPGGEWYSGSWDPAISSIRQLSEASWVVPGLAAITWGSECWKQCGWWVEHIRVYQTPVPRAASGTTDTRLESLVLSALQSHWVTLSSSGLACNTPSRVFVHLSLYLGQYPPCHSPTKFQQSKLPRKAFHATTTTAHTTPNAPLTWSPGTKDLPSKPLAQLSLYLSVHHPLCHI